MDCWVRKEKGDSRECGEIETVVYAKELER